MARQHCCGLWPVVGLALLLGSIRSAEGAEPRLTLLGPREISGAECTPFVADLVLRNEAGAAVRVARPDGSYNIDPRFDSRPAALRAIGIPGIGFGASESPTDTIDISAHGTYHLRVWLDRPVSASLLAGDCTVRVAYRPHSYKATWGISPALWGAELLTEPIRLVVSRPQDPDDRAALAIYQQEFALHWSVVWEERSYPPVGFLGPGELLGILDAPRAARLLLEAPAGPLDTIRAAVWPRAQAALGRLAANQPASAADVLVLRNALNERVILGPALMARGATAPTGASPTTIAALEMPEAGYDPTLVNRCLLEDWLPGCLPRTPLAVFTEHPRSPYAPLAMLALARSYSLRRHDKRLALWWLDRLLADHPAFALTDHVHSMRFHVLFDLGRFEDAAQEVGQFQHGQLLARRLLLVQQARAGGLPPPP